MGYSHSVLHAAIIAALIGLPAHAGIPDWANRVVAADVKALGEGYRSVTLADHEEIRYTSDQRKHITIHGAVRVMTEEGRARAVCRRDYNADLEKVTSARAWVISADGRNVRTMGVRDFVDVAYSEDDIFWPQQRELVYSAAQNVEIGGALVWEFEMESQVTMADHTADFPQRTPTLSTRVEVIPAPGATLQWHASDASIPAPSPGGSPGALVWEERDFRPKSRGREPDGFIPASRFIAIRGTNGTGGRETRSWTELGAVVQPLVQAQVAAISPELTAKAVALAAGASDRWGRIRALAGFIQKEIRYVGITLDKDSLAGYRPHAASAVFSSRFGDCKDKAVLLIAMLHAIGEEGYPTLVFSGDPTAVLPDWPSPRFNHMIICIPAKDDTPAGWPQIDGGALGKLVVFDPTNTFTPLGLLPEEDQGGFGLVVASPSTSLVALPTLEDNLTREVVIRMDAAGDAAIVFSEAARGTIGAEYHASRNARQHDQYNHVLEARFHRATASVEILQWHDSWDVTVSKLELNAEFLARGYGQKPGTLMLITPQLLPPRPTLTPWETSLKGTVWYPGRSVREHARITLPQGCTVEELPTSWDGSVAGLKASAHYRQTGQAVDYELVLESVGGFIDRASYEQIRTLILQADQASRRPVVVRAPAAVATGSATRSADGPATR